MTVTVKPSFAKGEVKAPPSKSMAHRYLICAALCGNCTVRGVDFSKDITATLGGLCALGARVHVAGDTVFFEKSVGGVESAEIDCCESGSTLRFLLPLAAALGVKTHFYGAKRLFERPLEVYSEIFSKCGVSFTVGDSFADISGQLNAESFYVRGDISSQYITGLMLALLVGSGGRIDVTTRLESAPYVALTMQAITVFGGKVTRRENSFFVESRALSSCDASVEGDYSNAAFFYAFNTLGGDVKVTGLLPDSLQGDAVCVDYLNRISNGTPTLDISDCPDLGPILFAAAAAKNGAKFVGTARLRIKESDRAVAMAQELAKFGVKTEVYDNSVVVGCGAAKPQSPLNCHNDHRIAMSLAVLASAYGGTLVGAECVSKSLPSFFEMIKSLGIEVQYDEA